MKRKETPLITIALLLMAMLTLALEIPQVKAEQLQYIYINDDGSVDPDYMPIQRDGDNYILNDSTPTGWAIRILRDGITLDGNNKTVTGLLGTRIGTGINLTGRKNVMIKNVTIRTFQYGILLNGSSNCQLYHNRIFDGGSKFTVWDPPEQFTTGIRLLNSSYNTLFHNDVRTYLTGIELSDSSHNRIFNSTLTFNGWRDSDFGIILRNSSYNNVFGNIVKNNHDGIGLSADSHNNSILYNRVTSNKMGDGHGVNIELQPSSYNTLKYNNVVGNSPYNQVVIVQSYNNSWDGGYPSGGNYWWDYTDVDEYSGPYQNETGPDGIWDTPYEIDNDTNNFDYYPVVNTIEYTYVYLTIEAGLDGTTDPVPETYPHPAPENYPYMERMNVTVTATPSEGYSFVNWTLDGGLRTENPITVTMDSNHTLKAWFHNHPPTNLTLSDPSPGYVYTDIPYTANASDPEHSNVTYEFSWGDNTLNTTTNQYPSGQPATELHSWSTPGNYTVKVQAQDIYGARSGWSNKSLSITQNDANKGVDAKDNFDEALFITPVGPYKGTLYNSTDPQDRKDYYRFDVVSGQPISVTMTPPTGVNFDLELYNSTDSTTPKSISNLTGDSTESISYTADSTGQWRILINMSDGEGQYSFSVSTGGGGGGCPYVSAWNGTQYVLDNNVLPSSEASNGTDVEDYYKLEQTLVHQNGKYQLLISEFEQEHSYIDQIKLIAVDHESNVNIVVTSDGEILTYKNPSAPISAVDNYGNDRVNEIRHMDGNVSDPATYFDGFPGDYLILNFGQVNSDNAKLILRDDMKKHDECIEVQVKDSNDNWQTVEVLVPRAYWSIEAVNLSPYVVQDQDFMVRLYWKYRHRLDYVGLDTTKQADYEIHTANLVSATHSTQGDVKALLAESDSLYAELVPSQQIQLEFTLPKNQKQARTYILYTKGHYYTIP